MALTLIGCSYWDSAYQKAAGASLRVEVMKSPTVVGMVKMLEPTVKPAPKLGDSVYYQFQIDLDDIRADLKQRDLQLAVIPTEMAAKLYHEGLNYQIAAINTGGFLYVLAEDDVINSWSDLKGKAVSLTDKGGATDTVFRYLLMENGIDPDKDLTLNYDTDAEVQAQAAIKGETQVTVLPEPWCSTVLSENDAFRIALDVGEEWMRIQGDDTPLAQTCLVVRSELTEEEEEAFALFLEDYSVSVDWVNQNPVETSRFVPNHDVGLTEEMAASIIPRSHLIFSRARDARPAVEKYLQVFLELSPDAIGNKLPDDDFYNQK
jgi:NitT/TauT family transport system substrate-binding protein